MSRLHEAAAVGDIEKVKEFLTLGDDVNDMSQTVSSKGTTTIEIGDFGRQMTPLHLAAYNGHTQVAELLIAFGADLDKKDGWNSELYDSALEIAINRKNFGLATLLKQSGAQDENNLLENALSNRDISNEMFLAVIYKKPDVVREIHASGLLTKEIAEEALIDAAKYNVVTIAEVLLDCGVSPNAYNNEKTALGEAAENGHDAIAALLLERGAEVDKYTSTTEWQPDCTPLREALIHLGNRPANPRLIELLLSYGADINKINERGLTCLAEFGKAEEIALVLKQGLDPNTMTEGYRLLGICFDSMKDGQYTEIIDLMIEHGAQPLQDDEGRTPLMCLQQKKFSLSVIDQYYKFEANYYQVDPEAYKRELINLHRVGYNTDLTHFSFFGEQVSRQNSIALFWNNIAKLQNGACQNGY